MSQRPDEPEVDATPADPIAPESNDRSVPRDRSAAAAALVGAGILASRVAGFVRDRTLASYFGTGLHADVFSAALRLPNVLQNLLGEGTLSASFIPVYSELLGQGRTREAGRLAGAVFALLLAIAGAFSLLGLTLAPLLVAVFLPGFEDRRYELMVDVVRIMFPMTGVLVLSAWALGVLNSHRRFFVSYFAPVVWNGAIIAALVAFGSERDLDGLLMAAAWGALAGGALQFAVQLPWVLKLDREIRVTSGRGNAALKEVVRNAVPAIAGRGVVQLSGYVDMFLATLLAVGALTRLRYAQTLYLLPVSLFGMSVAAAALPDLARQRTAATTELRERAVSALRRVAFYVVPSFVALIAIGDVLVAGLYRVGQFGAADVTVVWLVLSAYSLGLLASTATRVYQSAFFALRDTSTPARVAALRVLTAAVAGAALMVQLEPVTVFGFTIPAGVFAGTSVAGVPLGPVGLAAGAALGAWLEWWLLRGRLRSRIGTVGAGGAALARMFGAAVLAAAAARGTLLGLAGFAPLAAAAAVASVYGIVYLGAGAALGLGETRALVGGVRRRLRGR
ncbi:MAG TPA: murein biosynthesis integral membrane protein MurJ [Gammaproteobacteria bacterium]|nr:murein biosynthesis integral membrane protein MurJ [Gammaproteobacteria bacterium]